MLVTPDNFSDCLQKCRRPTLVVDLETTGLNPWLEDKIAGIAIFNLEETFYFPFNHGNSQNLTPEQMCAVICVLEEADLLINHNIKFDMAFLVQAGMSIYPDVIDSMFGLYLLNENHTLSLKKAAEHHLGVDSSKEEAELNQILMTWGYDKGDMWRLPAHVVAPYAEKDTRLAFDMVQFIKSKLASTLNVCWADLNHLSNVVLEMERNGLYVDMDVLRRLENEAELEAFKLHQELKRIFGGGFNAASPTAISKQLSLPDSTEETLLLYKGKKPGVEQILRFRWWRKAVDTYYKKYRLEWADANSVIHSKFNICGTVSGRFSLEHPNLQAVPRYSIEQKVKDVFVARPGHLFVEVDYSQAEIRLAAHYTQEQSLINAIREGKDIHQTVADEVGITRQTAKTINFATIYGAGARRLAEQLVIPTKQAAEFLNGYNLKYPGYRRTAKQAELTASERGYIVMWNGRRRHFNTREAEPHTAFNQLIQGGVGQMVIRAMNDIDRKLVHGLRLQVHDSLLFEVPKDEVDDFIPEVKEIMENQPQFSVPMTTDVKTGESWGQLKKYEKR